MSVLAIDAAGAENSKKTPNRVTSYITFVLLAIVSAVALGGLLRIESAYKDVQQLRSAASLARTAVDAVSEADRTVLQLLAKQNESPDLGSLTLAARAADLSIAQFLKAVTDPTTLTVQRDADTFAKRIDEIAAALRTSRYDQARSIYNDQNVEALAETLTGILKSAADRRVAAITVLQRDISSLTTWILVLQIVTGLICIIAFFLASRKSRRDSLDRELAVAATDASRQQLSHLFAMTDMLQSASDLEDANELLRATAIKLLPTGLSGALYVFSNSRDRLMLSTTWLRGDDAPELPKQIGLQECWALKRGKPHINGDQKHTLHCQHHGKSEVALEIPMIARGEILGLLIIQSRDENGEQILEKNRNIALALADAMSLALSNITLRDKLRSQALRDPLTGLYNRRYMEDALERTVLLAEREKTAVSVIMIDLDNFKRLNDQFGHAKGDAVLRDTAAAILGQLRETDIACRYGGEELLVVLPSCSIEVAAAKAERMRSSIASFTVANGPEISASFGVASYPATSVTTKELLLHADSALYSAKQKGRNRVVRYDGDDLVIHATLPSPLTLMAAE
ncbi:sensor domain-containing diguanylate cyclase [Variibacter gotjawalensis]|nr:sensor domain-containing diguanylate cyclase [Variibacter gotjawalensis]NIK47906.1 diguanylate cyclase (GGDEF)-like protein [Variibacter gotjawalensis]